MWVAGSWWHLPSLPLGDRSGCPRPQLLPTSGGMLTDPTSTYLDSFEPLASQRQAKHQIRLRTTSNSSTFFSNCYHELRFNAKLFQPVTLNALNGQASSRLFKLTTSLISSWCIKTLCGERPSSHPNRLLSDPAWQSPGVLARD